MAVEGSAGGIFAGKGFFDAFGEIGRSEGIEKSTIHYLIARGLGRGRKGKSRAGREEGREGGRRK